VDGEKKTDEKVEEERVVEISDLNIEEIFDNYFLNDKNEVDLLIDKIIDFNGIRVLNKTHGYASIPYRNCSYPDRKYRDKIVIAFTDGPTKGMHTRRKRIVYVYDRNDKNIYKSIQYAYIHDIKTLEAREGHFMMWSELYRVSEVNNLAEEVPNSFGMIELKDGTLPGSERIIPDIIVMVDEKKKIHFNKPVDDKQFIVFLDEYEPNEEVTER
jgi:hypothetical protein